MEEAGIVMCEIGFATSDVDTAPSTEIIRERVGAEAK